MKQIPICSRAFFNPYIFLNLDEFGCDSIIHPFTFLVNSFTSCCHFPLSLYSIICSSTFVFFLFLHLIVMCFLALMSWFLDLNMGRGQTMNILSRSLFPRTFFLS